MRRHITKSLKKRQTRRPRDGTVARKASNAVAKGLSDPLKPSVSSGWVQNDGLRLEWKMLFIIVVQRQNVAVSLLRISLLACLAVVIYVPVALLIHQGNESHGHLYAAIFPIAWMALILSAWLTARTSPKLSMTAVVIATACILFYYGLPRIAY